ncbi:hypothetical protein HH212_02525 [Massilia forsythiae]|uniref:Flagellin n=1 Tax=Massilia forsythiae TaxID=2728020 RepID=A0A7Z2ZRD3_9BURK|nr:hypothetical protein [Massilia forsythiae]QJD99048.1 hypothetical protein HH212_02525 [Massilia forsythiae]
MAIDTALRSSAGNALGSATSRTGGAGALVPARALDRIDSGKTDAAAASPPAPLRSNAGAAAIGSALQDGVARAQQALDYLERVAGQLENLKGEISAKLSANSRGGQRSAKATLPSTSQSGSAQQLDAQVRQLTAVLAARKSSAGGSVDANLEFTSAPSTQRFRIRVLDLDTLQQNAPQTLAFSVGGVGGPQMAATVTADQSSEEAARAIDRALAPLGVRAGVDSQGLVFSTAEANWPAVKDSIAVSGRGRVATEEVAPALAPQQWGIGSGNGATTTTAGNADALRQSLREVVQALERVRRSQDAASTALSTASDQVTAAATPPPDVDLAADEFASAAANTNYDSLLALTSALVGVSRERVLALLGLR